MNDTAERILFPVGVVGGVQPPPRAPLSSPLTPQQRAIVELAARGHNWVDIGERLRIATVTVRFHAKQAAAKVPGDLPAQMKLVLWARGAPLEVLNGTWLKLYEVMQG